MRNDDPKQSSKPLSQMSIFVEKKSNILERGGPSHHEQLLADAKATGWCVLNSHLLDCDQTRDERLNKEVNALKHGLQVHGPRSEKLLDYRNNKGNAKGQVFHGHCKHSQGTTYILEWAIVDEDAKKLAIVNFDKHENFPFRDDPLSIKEKNIIQENPRNVALMQRLQNVRKDAKNKIEKMSKGNQFNP